MHKRQLSGEGNPANEPPTAPADADGATFGFRLRFYLEPSHRFESTDKELLVEAGAILKALDADSIAQAHEFALQHGGFASRDAAERDGNRWADAIMIAGMRLRRGFDIGRFNLGGGLTPHGVRHFSELGNAPVRSDVHGLDTFEEDANGKRTRFISVTAKAETSSSVELLLEAVRVARTAPSLTPKLRLGLELFGLSRFEPSPRMQFLPLISAVEVLSERQKQASAVQIMVAELETLVNGSDAAVREALFQRVRDLRQESISRACRALVGSNLDANASKLFSNLYKKRSTLVHTGEVVGCDFVAEAGEAFVLVGELLERLVTAPAPTG